MAGPSKKISSKSIRPTFNTFSLADHILGRYLKGKHGLWYCNGGFPHIAGVAGRGNTFKSALIGSMAVTVSLRYNFEYTEFYDTETSMQVARIQDYINATATQHHWDTIPQIPYLLEREDVSWNYTASDNLTGDQWWNLHCRDERDGRRKTTEKNMRTTPFIDISGQQIKLLNPWIFVVDSLSELHVASVEKKFEKGTIGESDLNTSAMDDARSKAQLIAQMPNLAAQAGFYFGLVAHADDEIKMDMYAPSTKKLDGLKGNLKLKGVPGRGFTFLTNTCLLATHSSNLLNKSDKMPEYHHPDITPEVGDSDLKIVVFDQLRGKGGPTGEQLHLIFSQREGLQVGLSEFHFLNVLSGGFGLTSSGSGGAFKSLVIYPEVTFTRKTLWKQLRSDARLSRAMSITAALGLIYFKHYDVPAEEKIPVEDFYKNISEAGFDWNKIFDNTVEYWFFEDQVKDIGKVTVTARTLLDMANGKLTKENKLLSVLAK